MDGWVEEKFIQIHGVQRNTTSRYKHTTHGDLVEGAEMAVSICIGEEELG